MSVLYDVSSVAMVMKVFILEAPYMLGLFSTVYTILGLPLYQLLGRLVQYSLEPGWSCWTQTDPSLHCRCYRWLSNIQFEGRRGLGHSRRAAGSQWCCLESNWVNLQLFNDKATKCSKTSVVISLWWVYVLYFEHNWTSTTSMYKCIWLNKTGHMTIQKASDWATTHIHSNKNSNTHSTWTTGSLLSMCWTVSWITWKICH